MFGEITWLFGHVGGRDLLPGSPEEDQQSSQGFSEQPSGRKGNHPFRPYDSRYNRNLMLCSGQWMFSYAPCMEYFTHIYSPSMAYGYYISQIFGPIFLMVSQGACDGTSSMSISWAKREGSNPENGWTSCGLLMPLWTGGSSPSHA